MFVSTLSCKQSLFPEKAVPEEILSEFCEYALGMAKEYDTETNPDIAAEYTIAKAYTMVSNDPNWPHFSNVYGCSVVNGIAVIVPSAVIGSQWYFFVAPNFIVDPEGNIEYDEASILPWRPVHSSIEDVEGWARGLFFDMTITEMPYPKHT